MIFCALPTSHLRDTSGYGLTESVGMCAIMTPQYSSIGPVGVPVPAVEVKLKDHPEAGYLSSNTPPRGEVLIRGASVTKGYYKRDDLNNDPNIFPGDGWFRTVRPWWYDLKMRRHSQILLTGRHRPVESRRDAQYH